MKQMNEIVDEIVQKSPVPVTAQQAEMVLAVLTKEVIPLALKKDGEIRLESLGTFQAIESGKIVAFHPDAPHGPDAEKVEADLAPRASK